MCKHLEGNVADIQVRGNGDVLSHCLDCEQTFVTHQVPRTLPKSLQVLQPLALPAVICDPRDDGDDFSPKS
ncbi:hypothetical protein CMI37_37580 [Candidatus Pacearchaeota archaeon]|nr:hypothetical protein [Candidatus Pacearchaeota archaeon]